MTPEKRLWINQFSHEFAKIIAKNKTEDKLLFNANSFMQSKLIFERKK
jgi:cell fate regulator YaaT (PSP1 superfamily)